METYRHWFDTVLHLIRDSVIFTDLSGRIVLINPAAESLIGRKGADVIGKDVDEVLSNVTAEAGRSWQALIAGVLNGSASVEGMDCVLSNTILKKRLVVNIKTASEPNDKGRSIGALLYFQKPSQDLGCYKELSNNAARYLKLIDLTQQGVWIIDKDGVTTFVNPAMAFMLGYTAPEMVGKHLFEFMDQAGVALAKEKLQRRREGVREQHDFEFLHKEGRRVATTIETAPIADEEGNYAGAVAGIIDITKRRQAEQAVRKSEATLKQAQRVAKIGSWWFDVKTQQATWTEEIFHIFGLPPSLQTISYDSHKKIIHPEDWDRFDSMAERTIDEGIPFNIELRIVRPDGEVRFINSRCDVEKDSNGRVIQLIGTVQDITERKQMEETLREKERHLALAQEVAHIGSWRYEVDTRRLKWSDELFRIHGLDPHTGDVSLDVAVGMIHPKDRPNAQDTFNRALEQGRRYEIDYRIVRPDGEIRHIQGIGRIDRDPAGRIRGIFGTGQDITHRKNMEAALKESRNRFRTSFNSSAVGMVICDARGYFLELNEAFCHNLGLTRRDLAKKSFLDITHPKDVEVSKQNYRQCMIDGKPFSVEKRYLNKDGRLLWGMTSVTPIFDSDGSFLYAIAHCQDITGRKKAQEALVQSEHLLNESQKIANAGSYSVDTATKVVTWSDQAYRLFGYAPGEVQPDFDFVTRHIHPEDLERFLSANQACFSGEKDYDVTYRLIKKDGTVRVVHSRAYLKRDESGAPVRTIGALQDITEQVTAQQALKLSDQKFQSMMNHISVGVVLIDPDLNILEVNQQMKKWFPKAPWDQGPVCYRILNNPPRDTICEDCPAYRTFQDAAPHEANISSLTEDGLRNYRIVSSPIRGPLGKVSAVINTVEDITERLEYESKLRQAQKLESIGTLAGGIAHDFNNILSAIIGYTELALDDSEPGSMLEDSLHEIYRAGKRARDLVRQILTFARKSGEEIKPIDVQSIVKEVLKLIRSTIPANINIEQRLSSDSLIMGNAAQVHQILMNLCTNAAHAMEGEGGRLSIDLFDLKLDENDGLPEMELAAGNYLVIRVGDTGVGIAPDQIGSIFEPYFSTKGPGEGSGMGLAVVHGIVESYQGKITVKSTPGRGSVFQVYLPISTGCRERSPLVADQLPSGAERVLLIDDEVPIVKLSSQILARLGYRVTMMTDSIQALKLFRRNSSDFDLVITDMTMPGMTGDKLAAAMMEINPDIPIILHTGYSKRISEASVRKMGIKALVYKPLVKAEFAMTVRRVLDAARMAETRSGPRKQSREVEESL